MLLFEKIVLTDLPAALLRQAGHSFVRLSRYAAMQDSELYATNKLSKCYYTFCFVETFVRLRRMPHSRGYSQSCGQSVRRRKKILLQIILVFYFLLPRFIVRFICTQFNPPYFSTDGFRKLRYKFNNSRHFIGC